MQFSDRAQHSRLQVRSELICFGSLPVLRWAFVAIGLAMLFCETNTVWAIAQEGEPPPDPVPAGPAEVGVQEIARPAIDDARAPRLAEQYFELGSPQSTRRSKVTLTPKTLSIRGADNSLSKYQRLSRYDTENGEFIGYSSRELQQIIRWPVSGHGSMEIGTLQNGKIRFRPSQMVVIPIDGQIPLPHPAPHPGPILPPPGIVGGGLPLPNQQIPQLTPFAFVNGASNGFYLTLPTLRGNVAQARFALSANPTGPEATWFINPIARDTVRIQKRVGNRWYALTPILDDLPARNRPGRPPLLPVVLSPIASDRGQIWHVIPSRDGGYLVENARVPGYCLAFPPRGPFVDRFCLEPIHFEPWQIWYPEAPRFDVPIPTYETRQHQFVANDPFPPAEIQLTNRHTDELLVLVTDRRNPQTPSKIRIKSGEAQTILIDRDAGGKVVETVSIGDGLGNWNEQQFATEVPPQAYYEISVYEIFLQSIAIDRTGTSPDPIEDVNFQPRSIGLFIIPPGAAMQEGDSLPAFELAEEQQNPGAVRKLSERELKRSVEEQSTQEKKVDPLREILNQFQKERAAF